MSNRFAVCLAAVALFAGFPASAQSTAQPPEAEHIGDHESAVTRRHEMTPEEFDEAVEDFVTDLVQPGPINRISRWGEPLCPVAQGLSEPFNAFVADRIGEIAARVGAPAADECGEQANVLVLFTTSP